MHEKCFPKHQFRILHPWTPRDQPVPMSACDGQQPKNKPGHDIINC